MNRMFTIALFVLASFAADNASAQGTPLLKVTIPFAFTVNDTTLPAGEYVVSSLSLEFPDTLVIASCDFHHPRLVTMMTLGNVTLNSNTGKNLVFNLYRNRYFLHEIVSPIDSTDAILPTSKREKKLLVELASNGGGEPVLVAIKYVEESRQTGRDGGW